MAHRVAAARDPKSLAAWRVAWALVVSVVVAAAAHPAATAALTRDGEDVWGGYLIGNNSFFKLLRSFLLFYTLGFLQILAVGPRDLDR